MKERLGIVGTGAIAAGLARVAADHGEVVVWARSPESHSRAVEAVGDEPDVTTDLEALGSCTFVIEAVVEDRDVKSELLARLGRIVDHDAILGSTTSSLSVAELAQASGRPDRFAAVHVFNPVERMELVELATARGGQRRHADREVPHEFCLAHALDGRELAHAVPRELRLGQVVPAGEVECLTRAGQRWPELTLGVEEESERVALRIGQANGPHARTPWEEKLLPSELNPRGGRIRSRARAPAGRGGSSPPRSGSRGRTRRAARIRSRGPSRRAWATGPAR